MAVITVDAMQQKKRFFASDDGGYFELMGGDEGIIIKSGVSLNYDGFHLL